MIRVMVVLILISVTVLNVMALIPALFYHESSATFDLAIGLGIINLGGWWMLFNFWKWIK